MEIIFIKLHTLVVYTVIPYNIHLLEFTTCEDIITDKLAERFYVVRRFHIYKTFRNGVVSDNQAKLCARRLLMLWAIWISG